MIGSWILASHTPRGSTPHVDFEGVTTNVVVHQIIKLKKHRQHTVQKVYLFSGFSTNGNSSGSGFGTFSSNESNFSTPSSKSSQGSNTNSNQRNNQSHVLQCNVTVNLQNAQSLNEFTVKQQMALLAPVLE
ncbi:hypothetical protein Hanom_Chr03g00225661 [Helianthus anomalus]